MYSAIFAYASFTDAVPPLRVCDVTDRLPFFALQHVAPVAPSAPAVGCGAVVAAHMPDVDDIERREGRVGLKDPVQTPGRGLQNGQQGFPFDSAQRRVGGHEGLTAVHRQGVVAMLNNQRH